MVKLSIPGHINFVNKPSIRIKDIARKANVSIGTVDRVLHNRGRVSEEVRQKVLQIIEELDYQPNMIARTLGANRTYRIVALLPDGEIDPYWQESQNGIEKAAKELQLYGVQISQYIFNQHDVHLFIEKATSIIELNPDGILVAPVFYRESLPFFEQWHALNIPFVLFNTHIQESNPLSYIGQDAYQSGFLAGKLLHYGQPGACTFLVAHIAEDIANSAHLLGKERGFREYFSLNPELAGSYKVISADLKEPGTIAFFHQLDRLLDHYPDLKGIFVTTSKAYEIATYLQHMPERHIRLVGYDLLEKNITFLDEGLIDFIINQNPQGQGYWGIQYLADHLVFKKKVALRKNLPLDIITKENLAYYLEAGQ
jgi:LacI family transcriptional regulator